MKHVAPLKDPGVMRSLVEEAKEIHKQNDFSCVIGIEPHGFIIGSLIAYGIGTGFVPVRKKGKLPAKVVHIPVSDVNSPYSLLEIHEDALPKGKILLVDSNPRSTRLITAVTASLRANGGNVTHLFVISDEHIRIPETSELKVHKAGQT